MHVVGEKHRSCDRLRSQVVEHAVAAFLSEEASGKGELASIVVEELHSACFRKQAESQSIQYRDESYGTAGEPHHAGKDPLPVSWSATCVSSESSVDLSLCEPR